MKTKIFTLVITLLLVIGFFPQPAKAEGGSRITIYVVPAITDENILPTTSIPSDYISNNISIVASPGEFQPASFVVRANEDIVSLMVEASNLTSGNISIPSTDVDIRVVKRWYQAGVRIWNAINNLTILTPELPLKEEISKMTKFGKSLQQNLARVIHAVHL